MNDVRSVWRGEEPLVKTFWLYGVIPAVIFSMADSMIAQELPPVIGPGLAVSLMAFYIIAVAYVGFAIGAVWRSAGHYDGPRVWFYLARLWCIVGVIMLVSEILGMFGIGSSA